MPNDNWTKGEWKINAECKATYFIELSNNEGIVAIFTDLPERTKKIANMMVAAPDLLEVCEKIQTTRDKYQETGEDFDYKELDKLLDVAIAKANKDNQ